MTGKFFFSAAADRNERVFVASEFTAGPWAEHLQHGGPPNALAVAEAERAVLAETGRTDLVALRLAAEFVGPVPVGEIVVDTRIVRAARSAALVDIAIRAADRDCLHVRVWFVRAGDSAGVATPVAAPPALPGAGAGLGMEFGYGGSLDWRFVTGSFASPGPAAAWVRPQVGLYDGYELSGLARVVLIADSASGISAELDWTSWSFQNVDLDVHLTRPVVGEWVLMDAQTQVGAQGSALARSTLSDEVGVVGAGLQTLIVGPRRT